MFDLGDILGAASAYDAFIALNYNEIQKDLKALDSRQIEDLAYHLALSCPPQSLSAFKRSTLSCFATNTSNFTDSLSKALDIALKIKMLTDPKMATPHIGLTSMFNLELFQHFPTLAKALLEKCPDEAKNALRTKLQTTPTEHQAELLKNIKIAFGGDCYLIVPLTSFFGRASSNTITSNEECDTGGSVPLSSEFKLDI